jgi:hypothetical protein
VTLLELVALGYHERSGNVTGEPKIESSTGSAVMRYYTKIQMKVGKSFAAHNML